MTHILNLLLTLLRVLIHREHAQNDVLILDVRSPDQLLETLPVLRGIVRLHITVHLGLLQLLLYVVLRILLTLGSQFLVQSHTTVRRRVCRHLHILQCQILVVGTDALQQVHEFLHRAILQFALTQFSLLNQEADISLLLLGDGTLEGKGCRCRTGRGQRHTIQLTCGQHTVSQLQGCHLLLLVADASVELQPQLTLMHGRHVVVVCRYSEIATFLILDDLVVALHLLTLQGDTLALDRLLYAILHIAQHRCDGHHGLLLHILGRYHTFNGHTDPTLLNLQDGRYHRHILFLHGLQLCSPRCQRHNSQQHQHPFLHLCIYICILTISVAVANSSLFTTEAPLILVHKSPSYPSD